MFINQKYTITDFNVWLENYSCHFNKYHKNIYCLDIIY